MGNLYSAVNIPTEGGAVPYTRLPATGFEMTIGTVVHVADLVTTDTSGNPKSTFAPGSTLYWRVKGADRNGNLIAGGSVSSAVTKPNGKSLSNSSATTGADGWALFSVALPSGAATGNYQVKVSNITKTGTLYEPMENVKTTIVVQVQ